MDSIFHMSVLFLLGAMSSGVLSGEAKGKEARWTGITAMAASGLAALQLSTGLVWESVPVDALFLFTVIGLLRIALGTHPVAGKPRNQDALTLVVAMAPIALFVFGKGVQPLVGYGLLTLGALGGLVWMGEPIEERPGAGLRRMAQMIAAFGVACVGGWWLTSAPAPIFADATLCAVFLTTFTFSAARSAEQDKLVGLEKHPTLAAEICEDGGIQSLNAALTDVLKAGASGEAPKRLHDILTPATSVDRALRQAVQGEFEKSEGYIWLPGGGVTAVEFGMVRCPRSRTLQCVIEPVSPGKSGNRASRAQTTALRRLAYSDPLTGGKNRRFLELELNRCLIQSMRTREPLSLVMFDLDHFKTINDVHGHLLGDQLLQAVVEICQVELREKDSVCRYGGDEFVVLLPNTPRHAANRVAHRLRREIRTQCQPLVPSKVSGSFGVLTYEASDGLRRPAALLHGVDLALLESKRKGRNCVTVGELPGPSDLATVLHVA